MPHQVSERVNFETSGLQTWSFSFSPFSICPDFSLKIYGSGSIRMYICCILTSPGNKCAISVATASTPPRACSGIRLTPAGFSLRSGFDVLGYSLVELLPPFSLMHMCRVAFLIWKLEFVFDWKSSITNYIQSASERAIKKTSRNLTKKKPKLSFIVRRNKTPWSTSQDRLQYWGKNWTFAPLNSTFTVNICKEFKKKTMAHESSTFVFFWNIIHFFLRTSLGVFITTCWINSVDVSPFIIEGSH